MKIAIYGAGSWGTALAVVFGRTGHQVTLLDRRPESVLRIQRDRVNVEYFDVPEPGTPGYESYVLPRTVEVDLDLNYASRGPKPDLIVIATPSRLIEETVDRVAEVPLAPILIASKGMTEEGFLLPEVVQRRFPDRRALVGCLSGPNIADEVIVGLPSSAVCAFPDLEFSAQFADELTTNEYILESSTDVLGAALYGATKNVIAIGAGICDALGYRGNTRAILGMRGLVEMSYIGHLIGADPATVLGPAGFGDLMVTMESSLSRNHRMGMRLGEGLTLEQARAEVGQEVEGIQASFGIMALAKRQGAKERLMPILRYTHDIIQGKVAPAYVIDRLLTLYRKHAEATGLGRGTGVFFERREAQAHV